MKIETAVARNRKFVKAGPAPAWLWLCGLAYCQESLTDGFIPHEAITFLGVKNARHLVGHLVAAQLWEEKQGGWQVHDYLQHNISAEDIKRHNGKRAANGALGGRPPKPRQETLGLPDQIDQIRSEPIDQNEGSDVPLRSTTPAALTFPVVGRGLKSWDLSEDQVAAWQTCYPGIDVLSESLKALAWVQANPERRKTARGMSAFLVNWLNRATNRGQGGSGPRAAIAAVQDFRRTREPWVCPHVTECPSERICANATACNKPRKAVAS